MCQKMADTLAPKLLQDFLGLIQWGYKTFNAENKRNQNTHIFRRDKHDKYNHFVVHPKKSVFLF